MDEKPDSFTNLPTENNIKLWIIHTFIWIFYSAVGNLGLIYARQKLYLWTLSPVPWKHTFTCIRELEQRQHKMNPEFQEMAKSLRTFDRLRSFWVPVSIALREASITVQKQAKEGSLKQYPRAGVSSGNKWPEFTLQNLCFFFKKKSGCGGSVCNLNTGWRWKGRDT